MKYILAFFVLFFAQKVVVAQSLTKKESKVFVKAFVNNYEAAKTHFKDNIDLAKRDEVLGMPSSKIPLPNNTRNYFDAATYAMTYVYSFEDEKDAKECFVSMMSSIKSKLPKQTEILEESSYYSISNPKEEGNYPTVESSVEGTTIVIMFNPALDVSLPMDY